MPFLGVYLLETRSTPLSTIAFVYLLSGLLSVAGQVASGWLADVFGSRRILLAGYAISLTFALVLGYLVLVRAPVPVFLALYPLFTLFRGMSQTALSALVAALRPSEVRRGFSWLNIGGNLGFAIGPALGGFVMASTNYADVFAVSAFAALLTATGAWIWVPRRVPQGGPRSEGQGVRPGRPRRWLSLREDAALLLLLALLFCLFLCIGYEITPLSLYVADVFHFSDRLIGYLFATNGILIVLFQLPMTRLIERARPLVLPLIASAALAAASFLVAAFSRSFLGWELVMTLITFAEILCTVPAQSIVALFAVEGNRGTYQGYVSGVTSAGRAVAAFLGPVSFAIAAASPPEAWIAVAAFAFVTGAGLAWIAPRIERLSSGRDAGGLPPTSE
jgi:predicted MFS family arabinose efflux permease